MGSNKAETCGPFQRKKNSYVFSDFLSIFLSRVFLGIRFGIDNRMSFLANCIIYFLNTLYFSVYSVYFPIHFKFSFRIVLPWSEFVKYLSPKSKMSIWIWVKQLQSMKTKPAVAYLPTSILFWRHLVTIMNNLCLIFFYRLISNEKF